MKKIMLLILAVGLTGCATTEKWMSHPANNTDVQANSIAPTKIPSDLSAGDMQSYYPIPPTTNPNEAAPSLLPPNSQMAQLAQASGKTILTPAASSVVASSSTGLVLNSNYEQAWRNVGRALPSAGYKVMQQDKSMGAYYVLDTAATGGKIKTDTPIYRINLKQSGNNTTVTVLDSNSNPANSGVSSRILGALKAKL